jgi:hypothetical protein
MGEPPRNLRPTGQIRPRRFYRIVLTDPPTLIDFTSHAAQGRVLRRHTPTLVDRWHGISVYETEEQARYWARKRPYLGTSIAELLVDPTYRYQQTGKPGHYTLWGEPRALLGCVCAHRTDIVRYIAHVYCAVWGRNLIAEFDREKPALAMARDLLEDGFPQDELSLELGEGDDPIILHGQQLLERIRAAYPSAKLSA